MTLRHRPQSGAKRSSRLFDVGASPGAMRKLRCAVYTRKSSEEGLDMDFNSLDAQWESCEAYIASQRAEGSGTSRFLRCLNCATTIPGGHAPIFLSEGVDLTGSVTVVLGMAVYRKLS